MYIQIGSHTLSATLSDNSSADALKELLEQGPLIINMQDYAKMEKVGDLGTTLPTHDEHINTQPGDLILYQGSSFVVYYGKNSWSLTRLGRINDVTQEELVDILGPGTVSVTLSLIPPNHEATR